MFSRSFGFGLCYCLFSRPFSFSLLRLGFPVFLFTYLALRSFFSLPLPCRPSLLVPLPSSSSRHSRSSFPWAVCSVSGGSGSCSSHFLSGSLPPARFFPSALVRGPPPALPFPPFSPCSFLAPRALLPLVHLSLLTPPSSVLLLLLAVPCLRFAFHYRSYVTRCHPSAFSKATHFLIKAIFSDRRLLHLVWFHHTHFSSIALFQPPELSRLRVIASLLPHNLWRAERQASRLSRRLCLLSQITPERKYINVLPYKTVHYGESDLPHILLNTAARHILLTTGLISHHSSRSPSCPVPLPSRDVPIDTIDTTSYYTSHCSMRIERLVIIRIQERQLHVLSHNSHELTTALTRAPRTPTAWYPRLKGSKR